MKGGQAKHTWTDFWQVTYQEPKWVGWDCSYKCINSIPWPKNAEHTPMTKKKKAWHFYLNLQASAERDLLLI